MEINASCVFDYSTIKALYRTMYSKRTKPSKRLLIFSIICLISILLIVGFMFLFGFDSVWLFLLVMEALLYGIELYFYFLVPKIWYKKMGKMQGTENKYFFCDENVRIVTENSENNGEETVNYTLFEKAYETAEYIYVYKTKYLVYPIDKSTIEGGTIEELRAKLSGFLGKKYVVYNY